jgi:tetratricopeptide (TPR) repeat protein
LVRRAAPKDMEAQDKSKQLAATETIARGNYEGALTTETPAAAGAKATPTPPPEPRKGTPAPARQVPTAVTPRPLVPQPAPRAPAKSRAAPEEQSLRARLASEPANPDHYLQLAALHSRQGNFEEARAVLERGVTATGGKFELNLALADLEIQPLRRQLAQAEEQLQGQPGDQKLAKAREVLLADINARELAYYRRKMEHDPADKGTRYELGVRLFRAGQIDEAICELQAVRSDARLRGKALAQLGHCFQARQNWPLARRNFEEALRALPEGEEAQRKEVLFNLAQGHAGAGELERAVELGLDLADLDFAYRNIGRLVDEWQGRARKPTPK